MHNIRGFVNSVSNLLGGATPVEKSKTQEESKTASVGSSQLGSEKTTLKARGGSSQKAILLPAVESRISELTGSKKVFESKKTALSVSGKSNQLLKDLDAAYQSLIGTMSEDLDGLKIAKQTLEQGGNLKENQVVSLGNRKNIREAKIKIVECRASILGLAQLNSSNPEIAEKSAEMNEVIKSIEAGLKKYSGPLKSGERLNPGEHRSMRQALTLPSIRSYPVVSPKAVQSPVSKLLKNEYSETSKLEREVEKIEVSILKLQRERMSPLPDQPKGSALLKKLNEQQEGLLLHQTQLLRSAQFEIAPQKDSEIEGTISMKTERQLSKVVMLSDLCRQLCDLEKKEVPLSDSSKLTHQTLERLFGKHSDLLPLAQQEIRRTGMLSIEINQQLSELTMLIELKQKLFQVQKELREPLVSVELLQSDTELEGVIQHRIDLLDHPQSPETEKELAKSAVILDLKQQLNALQRVSMRLESDIPRIQQQLVADQSLPTLKELREKNSISSVEYPNGRDRKAANNKQIQSSQEYQIGQHTELLKLIPLDRERLNKQMTELTSTLSSVGKTIDGLVENHPNEQELKSALNLPLQRPISVLVHKHDAEIATPHDRETFLAVLEDNSPGSKHLEFNLKGNFPSVRESVRDQNILESGRTSEKQFDKDYNREFYLNGVLCTAENRPAYDQAVGHLSPGKREAIHHVFHQASAAAGTQSLINSLVGSSYVFALSNITTHMEIQEGQDPILKNTVIYSLKDKIEGYSITDYVEKPVTKKVTVVTELTNPFNIYPDVDDSKMTMTFAPRFD